MFAGDSVAGEANWGTLRSLLVRPVARPKLLRSKLAVAVMLAVAATIAVPLTGLVAGTIAFGWHDVGMPFFGSIPAAEGLGRLVVATAYVAWGYASIVAFAFLLSTLTDTPAGAIGGAIGLGVASQILDAISALRDIRFGLPTHYWTSWTSLSGAVAMRSRVAAGSSKRAWTPSRLSTASPPRRASSPAIRVSTTASIADARTGMESSIPHSAPAVWS